MQFNFDKFVEALRHLDTATSVAELDQLMCEVKYAYLVESGVPVVEAEAAAEDVECYSVGQKESCSYSLYLPVSHKGLASAKRFVQELSAFRRSKARDLSLEVLDRTRISAVYDDNGISIYVDYALHPVLGKVVKSLTNLAARRSKYRRKVVVDVETAFEKSAEGDAVLKKMAELSAQIKTLETELQEWGNVHRNKLNAEVANRIEFDSKLQQLNDEEAQLRALLVRAA